jgi:hypothetical protein
LDFWLGCAVKWNTVEPSVKNQEHLQTESNAQLCPIRNTAGIDKDLDFGVLPIFTVFIEQED